MKSPSIDLNDYDKLIQIMREMVPNYTPEWRFTPEYPDAGTALLMIFARMFEEAVNRFNQVPYKNFIAFLNLLNAKMAPSCPAQGYLTFNLSVGAMNGVPVKKNKQVFAAEKDSEEKIVFETQEDVFVIPAGIVEVINVSPKYDRICRAGFTEAGQEARGFRFFDFSADKSLQEHRLYIAHSNVLDMTSHGKIEITLNNSINRQLEESACRRLAEASNVEWTYFSDGLWHEFDSVSAEGNSVVLVKAHKAEFESTTVNEIENRWICCLVKDVSSVSHIAFDGIKIRSCLMDSGNGKGISPEKVFCNELEVQPEKIFPFGERFSLYDAFYLSSNEIFSKKGSEVSIELDIDFKKFEQEIVVAQDETEWKLIMKKNMVRKPPKLEISIAQVSWEYWNGMGWSKLFIDPEYDALFSRGLKTVGRVKFKCPEDFEKNYVNSQYGYWIKVTVVKMLNPYAVPGYYMSPLINRLSLDYRYVDGSPDVDNCIVSNNMELVDITPEVTGRERKVIKPFRGIECEKPAVYFGFDRAPVGAPVRLLVQLKTANDGQVPAISWEYLKRTGLGSAWEPLKVIDKTDSFKYTGLVSFAGEKDFAKEKFFNSELYWIRAINTDGRYDKEYEELQLPEVEGIYVNTVEIVQQETIGEELFSIENGQQFKECLLSKSPVLNEEIWVNEFGTLSQNDMHCLKQESMFEVREIKDESGIIVEFWVRWKRTDDIFLSDSDDRHYMIDEHSGIVGFGDGIHGRIPAYQDGESIKVVYASGGGRKGNVETGKINILGSPIAYIDSIYNPAPAVNGCDRQFIEPAVEIASKIIKHQNRAVTADDYENLAKSSSSNVIKAKCLSNYNIGMEHAMGSTTVVILPSTYELGQQYSISLRRQVCKYLTERAPCGQIIAVIEPVYIKISVSAEIYVKDLSIVADVEDSCTEAISRFLNPVYGNNDRHGWEIGEIPHITKFYSLLKGVEGVYHIGKIVLYAVKIENDRVYEIDINDVVKTPHAVPVSGQHQVSIYLAE